MYFTAPFGPAIIQKRGALLLDTEGKALRGVEVGSQRARKPGSGKAEPRFFRRRSRFHLRFRCHFFRRRFPGNRSFVAAEDFHSESNLTEISALAKISSSADFADRVF